MIKTADKRGTEDVGQVLAVNASLALQNAGKPETKLSANHHHILDPDLQLSLLTNWGICEI